MADVWDDEMATNLSTKRVRSWESCDDVQELKRILIEKEDELYRVVTDKDKQLAELQRKLNSAKKQPASSLSGPPNSSPSNSKVLEEQVARLSKFIQSQVVNQMVYKPSARYGSARLVPLDFYDITEPIIKSLIGEELFMKASSGPKELKIELSNEDAEAVFNHNLSKRLRYGATLKLSKGLKLILTKSDGSLKVSGRYTMVE